MICQATRTEPATVTVDSQSPAGPYHHCAGSAQRLEDLALRPLEWFSLAATHGLYEFSLHDDFSDNNGEFELG